MHRCRYRSVDVVGDYKKKAFSIVVILRILHIIMVKRVLVLLQLPKLCQCMVGIHQHTIVASGISNKCDASIGPNNTKCDASIGTKTLNIMHELDRTEL